MAFNYREITKQDLPKWQALAAPSFLERDFCDEAYFLKHWDKVKGWVLLTEKDEWIGCCFIDTKDHVYNPGGVHFLEAVIFPEFRNSIYGKYLIKIMFDNSVGFQKSACVSPENPNRLLELLGLVGFKKAGMHRGWHVLICDKDYYPERLKQLKIGGKGE